MSSGNRKIFANNIPASPLDEVDNEENSAVILTALMAVVVATLVGILAWYFGFGNQIDDFAQENQVMYQVKDWAIQFIQHISSIFNDRILQ